ncbi:MAG: hypothetical protein ACLFTE_03275 [Salinivenus sp.]
MSESYRAILVDGRLQWLDEVPDEIRHGSGEVRVRITVEQRTKKEEEELVSLLDELAEADPFSDIDDPVEWQRRLRQEDLPEE